MGIVLLGVLAGAQAARIKIKLTNPVIKILFTVTSQKWDDRRPNIVNPRRPYQSNNTDGHIG